MFCCLSIWFEAGVSLQASRRDRGDQKVADAYLAHGGVHRERDQAGLRQGDSFLPYCLTAVLIFARVRCACPCHVWGPPARFSCPFHESASVSLARVGCIFSRHALVASVQHSLTAFAPYKPFFAWGGWPSHHTSLFSRGLVGGCRSRAENAVDQGMKMLSVQMDESACCQSRGQNACGQEVKVLSVKG